MSSAHLSKISENQTHLQENNVQALHGMICDSSGIVGITSDIVKFWLLRQLLGGQKTCMDQIITTPDPHNSHHLTCKTE